MKPCAWSEVGTGPDAGCTILPCRAAQAIWFSASKDLSEDARRDFRDIGALKYDPVRIHNLRSVLPKAQWGDLNKAPGAYTKAPTGPSRERTG